MKRTEVNCATGEVTEITLTAEEVAAVLEAEALRLAALPIVDPKDAIRAEIVQLETAQLMPRVTREFMLLFMELNGGTAVPGYAPLKAFDEQVKALRAQL